LKIQTKVKKDYKEIKKILLVQDIKKFDYAFQFALEKY
jgi:hypothetical protein